MLMHFYEILWYGLFSRTPYPYGARCRPYCHGLCWFQCCLVGQGAFSVIRSCYEKTFPMAVTQNPRQSYLIFDNFRIIHQMSSYVYIQHSISYIMICHHVHDMSCYVMIYNGISLYVKVFLFVFSFGHVMILHILFS